MNDTVKFMFIDINVPLWYVCESCVWQLR